VNVFTSSGEQQTLYTQGISSEQLPEIILNFFFDIEKKQVQISIKANENYLLEYEGLVEERAISKGYNDIDISELRKEVIADISQSVEYSVKAVENEEDKVVECLRFWQVAQLNVKHIWKNGNMHQATWYSNNETYNKFPAYAHFGCLTAGGCDAIIEEVLGIPLIIRTAYQLMSDEEQQKAFAQIFTKDGFNALKNSVKDEAIDAVKNPEKGIYYGTKTTTTIAFAMVLGGGNLLIKGGKKALEIFEVLEKLGEKFKDCAKTTQYIGRLKARGDNVQNKIDEVSKLADDVGKEQLEKLAQQTKDVENAVNQLHELSEKIPRQHLEKILQYVPDNEVEDLVAKLHKIKDIEGFDLLTSDMSTYWTKFKGGKFVVDYVSEQGDDFVKNITKFEAEDFIVIGSETKVRKYDILVDKEKFEFKDWSDWRDWSDKVVAEQFIKDLNGIKKLNELVWVFKKTEGISDINLLRKNVIKALESNT